MTIIFWWSIQFMAYINSLLLFYCSVVQTYSCLIIHWKTSGLFPLGRGYKYLCSGFYVNTTLNFFMIIPIIAGSKIAHSDFRNCQNISRMTIIFYIPTSSVWVIQFSHISPTFGDVTTSYFNHSVRCVVLSHWLMMLNIFYVLIWQLYLLNCQMSVYTCAYFLLNCFYFYS